MNSTWWSYHGSSYNLSNLHDLFLDVGGLSCKVKLVVLRVVGDDGLMGVVVTIGGTYVL